MKTGTYKRVYICPNCRYTKWQTYTKGLRALTYIKCPRCGVNMNRGKKEKPHASTDQAD